MGAIGEKRKKRKGTASTACLPYDMCDWECEEDLRALARAAAVNKDPERLAKVKKLAAKKLEENKNRLAEMQDLVDLGEGKNI